MSGAYNIEFTAGDTLEFQITLKNPNDTPQDLTGYTVKSEIRSSPTSTFVMATFTVRNAPLGADGRIVLRLEAVDTEIFRTSPSGVYDVQITKDSDGTRRTILGGTISAIMDVTQ